MNVHAQFWLPISWAWWTGLFKPLLLNHNLQRLTTYHHPTLLLYIHDLFNWMYSITCTQVYWNRNSSFSMLPAMVVFWSLYLHRLNWVTGIVSDNSSLELLSRIKLEANTREWWRFIRSLACEVHDPFYFSVVMLEGRILLVLRNISMLTVNAKTLQTRMLLWLHDVATLIPVAWYYVENIKLSYLEIFDCFLVLGYSYNNISPNPNIWIKSQLWIFFFSKWACNDTWEQDWYMSLTFFL